MDTQQNGFFVSLVIKLGLATGRQGAEKILIIVTCLFFILSGYIVYSTFKTVPAPISAEKIQMMLKNTPRSS